MKTKHPFVVIDSEIRVGLVPSNSLSHSVNFSDRSKAVLLLRILFVIDGWLRMGLLPPLGNFADISYLVEN